MYTNNGTDSADKMVTTMERIAKDLELVIFWLSISSGLLFVIALISTIRFLLGR